MPLNLPVKSIFSQDIDMADIFHFQIQDTAAFLADKVVMRGSIPVKTVRADAGGYFLDFPKLG